MASIALCLLYRQPIVLVPTLAAMGSVPSSVSPIVTGILNGSGQTRESYVGGVAVGALFVALGICAPVIVGLGLVMPHALIGILAGLALLSVLKGALLAAFNGFAPLGASVTFLVTVSGVSVLNIGAAFWGLVFGCVTSLLLERKR